MADRDARSLARDLAAVIDGTVRFDDGSRAIYSTDASNHRQIPIGVVEPRSRDDVVRAIEVCRAHDVPVLPRGAGTSLAGQACNAAVVLDFSRHLDRIVSLDPEERTARVEPGVVLDDLQRAAAPHGLVFGPAPATHDRCTLGGMLGNDACGIRSVSVGRTVDHVVSLEILTYDGHVLEVGATPDDELDRAAGVDDRRGAIHRAARALRDHHADAIRDAFPAIPRRVSGYNLDALLPESGLHLGRALVGSEGTCVTILEATVGLVARPGGRALLVLGFDDVVRAATCVPRLLERGPIGLEGIDEALVRTLDPRGGDRDLLPDGRAWLLVEFGADTRTDALDRARQAQDAVSRGPGVPATALHDDPAREARVWQIRESGLGATARTADGRETWPGWEDSAVHPNDLASYLRDLLGLFDAYGFEASIYGHFGDGCVHCRIPFDLASADGVATYRRFLGDAAALVCGTYGGSLSGEHGDGVTRGALLGHMYPDDVLDAMREFRRIWDPAGRMNPGRGVEARSPTDHLRLGSDYAPPDVDTAFTWPDDGGDFSRAVLRCVGVGACRRTSGGTMCPSYRATRDETHSTRGRARILFEMLRGETIDPRRPDAVEEALDLCLSCKACKRECPASVDMASLKAEFLHHRYRHRIRPRAAYSMGRIRTWARLASRAPGLANAVTAGPLGGLVKRIGGIAPEREIPRFADETFTRWLRRRPAGDPDRPPVLLWPDTFHDHFEPRVARAAVEVLEAAGYRVTIPSRPVCCGRPLYDFGMLGRARRRLEEVLDVLREPLRAGVAVVGLEPSCVATFRDETPNLLPHDPDARLLGERAMLLGEFLVDEAGWTPPSLGGRVLLHVHCHQDAVLTTAADRALLDAMGFEVDAPDTGCCGMAGSFGFERDKFDVSIAVAGDAFLPALRGADPATRIVADGFSCREQARQLAGRRPLHLAELLTAAIDPSAPPAAPR